ncbi:hypothetical protein [Asticcacaulis sp. AC402]|uniref:hypothetical protein n=1 Tax=Asticcacaulis sp. AC402 TaxID=1282361 RepID=UPI0003C3E8BC|nr:hypothetical protein [Asticcacaulis sp. AC402]ESQ74095.1 hypothetical protein ABAC402_15700 [Asticcacaulis sp. AC402]
MGSARIFLTRGCAAVVITTFVAGPASTATPPKQVVTGPVATYWIDTTTSSGFSMAGLGGSGMSQGKAPSMSSMMGMMSGDVNHTVTLTLGSNQVARTETTGDHRMTAGDLPLYYKRTVATPTQPTPYTPGEPQSYEPPKGKILIYWGCGERAAAGQPLVIDLARITDPNQRMTLVKQLAPQVTLDTVKKPTPDSVKAYGEWPNAKTDSGFTGHSLTGAHTVKTDYAPQIDFSLNQGQDFLAPIKVSGNQKAASGAVPLTWAAIPNARGFVATAIGAGRERDTFIMWTSAASNTGWMGMAPDYLTPGDIERLTASKVLLPGTATACTVPAEVANAGEGAMYNITAYGGETNLSYPARPADPKVAWNIQWTTKIRYKSQTGGLLGQDMGGAGMFGMTGRSEPEDQAPPETTAADKKKKKKNSLFGEIVKQGVGSLIP